MRLSPDTNLLLIGIFLIVAIFIAATSDEDIAKCEKRMSHETCMNELRP